MDIVNDIDKNFLKRTLMTQGIVPSKNQEIDFRKFTSFYTARKIISRTNRYPTD